MSLGCFRCADEAYHAIVQEEKERMTSRELEPKVKHLICIPIFTVYASILVITLLFCHRFMQRRSMLGIEEQNIELNYTMTES